MMVKYCELFYSFFKIVMIISDKSFDEIYYLTCIIGNQFYTICINFRNISEDTVKRFRIAYVP